MPITTEYNGEFITAQMSGVVTVADLLALAEKVDALEAQLPVTPHRIADLSGGAVSDFNFVELSVFAAKRRAARLKNPVKSAIVAGDAVQFGFARMFQTLNDHPDIRIEVFQSEAPALAWLRE